jgi:hypothetical protein
MGKGDQFGKGTSRASARAMPRVTCWYVLQASFGVFHALRHLEIREIDEWPLDTVGREGLCVT